MSTKKSAPTKKSGQSNNSISYGVAPREAFKEPVQISNSGLQSIKKGLDPEKGTSGIS